MNKKLKIGVVAPSSQVRDQLRRAVETRNLGSVAMESAEYGTVSNASLVDQFQKVAPDIVFVDAQDPDRMLVTISLAQEALPNSWILVTSDDDDSNLILSTVRAGAREFLINPVSPADLSDAVERYFIEMRRQGVAVERGKIYSITSTKGGAGSTSLAVNLAAAISGLPETKVALVDLDRPFGDTSTYLNLAAKFTVADALSADSRLDSVLLESYMSRSNGFDVLPAPQEFQTGDVPDLKAIQKTLEVFAATYTHTLVDLPAACNYHELNLFSEQSQEFIVVLTPELTAVSRTHRLLRVLERCGGIDTVRLVLNRATKNDEITKREIEKTLEMPVYFNLPNDYRASIEALNIGKPALLLNHSGLASGYTQLAKNLTGISTKRKGLLGLFS